MQTLIRSSRAGALALGMALAAISTVQAQPPAPSVSAQDTTPYAYCWTTREIDNGTRRTYYFSRVWSMGRDGPTIGFQPQFQSFISARYSSRGEGSSAQCLRFFGAGETDRHRNDLAARASRDGNEVVYTNWTPR